MTRKHYNELAARFGTDLAAIGNVTKGERTARSGYLDAIGATVDALKCDNPRFDRDRFYSAVRMAEEKAIAKRFEVAS